MVNKEDRPVVEHWTGADSAKREGGAPQPEGGKATEVSTILFKLALEALISEGKLTQAQGDEIQQLLREEKYDTVLVMLREASRK